MKSCLLIDDDAATRINILNTAIPQIKWEMFDYDKSRDPKTQVLAALDKVEKNPADLLWLDVVFYYSKGRWVLDEDVINRTIYLGPPVLVVSSVRDMIIEIINDNTDHQFHAPIDFAEFFQDDLQQIRDKIDCLMPDLPDVDFDALNLSNWNLRKSAFHWRKTFTETFAGKIEKNAEPLFDLIKDDPFVVAEILSDYALRSSSERSIDLSRGDPHYASSPRAAKCIHFWHQFSQLLQEEADLETGYDHSTVIDSVRMISQMRHGI